MARIVQNGQKGNNSLKYDKSDIASYIRIDQDLVPLTAHVHPKWTKGDKMYIQDEKQKIVGNLDIPGKWGDSYDTSRMWTNVLIVPEIGAFVMYKGKSYVITFIRIFLEKTDPVDITEKTTILVECSILPISDEGDDISSPDNPLVVVEADELTII